MLDQVIIPANVYRLMLSHAYSTEKEEIIGMLIGYWKSVPSNNPYIGPKTVGYAKHISFLTRSDKRKDRVEIATESLHLAALQAEEFSKTSDIPLMVIGWYHSHPHITVFPSHVDIRTQLSQQLMDEKFFGIIISCFDTNNDNTEKTQITCFQSKETEKVNIPLIIEPIDDSSKDTHGSYFELCDHMYEEHKNEYITSNKQTKYDLRYSSSVSLPNTINQLYNAGIYGQSITSLIDHMIIPATHIMDLKSIALDKEIIELKKLKDKLMSGTASITSSPSSSPSPTRAKPKNLEDYLIQL